MMTKDANKSVEKPKGKLKKILLISTFCVILITAGIGGGIYYAGGISGNGHAAEDPILPKLVERSEFDAAEPEAGSEGKDAPLKTGTISVKSDTAKVDPKKYTATYLPLDQSFTANLADGAGFVQVGLSIATYYDGTVITNVKQEMVPIRSAILMVLSEENVEILSTPEGKHRLQKKLTGAINTVLRDKHGFGGIDNVYFTNLVIQ
jgi:flagellar protein FliL